MTSTLVGSKYLSVLDCFSRYWQMNIKEEDKEKTAFIVPSGPYGISDSATSFHRLMDIILRKLTGTKCWVSVDDVIIYAQSVEPTHTVHFKSLILANFESFLK
jgi:hypothetical protein